MVMTDAAPWAAVTGITALAVEAAVTQPALPHWIGGGPSGPARPSLLA